MKLLRPKNFRREINYAIPQTDSVSNSSLELAV